MITLQQANKIIEQILRKGRELDCRPLAVVVLELGAVVKAFQKEDHASMIRFEMAFGKAYASLSLGRSSNLVRIRAEEKPIFMEYLIKASNEKIFPEGGGQLIRDQDGNIIGAVGVTGDKEEVDDKLAIHGIQSAGLKCDLDCIELGNKVRLD